LDNFEDSRISKEEFVNLLVKMQFITEKKKKSSSTTLSNMNNTNTNVDNNV